MTQADDYNLDDRLSLTMSGLQRQAPDQDYLCAGCRAKRAKARCMAVCERILDSWIDEYRTAENDTEATNLCEELFLAVGAAGRYGNRTLGYLGESWIERADTRGWVKGIWHFWYILRHDFRRDEEPKDMPNNRTLTVRDHSDGGLWRDYFVAATEASG